MSVEESWDWVMLYYAGTVLLHMSESQFWQCVPRKLITLINLHVELNNTEDKGNGTNGTSNKAGFIDQVF